MQSFGTIYFYSILSFFTAVYGLNFLIRNTGLVVSKILSVQLLLVSYILFAGLMVSPANIKTYPHFFKTIIPFFYLFPVLTYLFQYYLLHPLKKFNFKFLFLTIPFLLQIAENFRFYTSPTDIKLAEINLMLQHKNYFYASDSFKWIEPSWHPIFVSILFSVFFFVMLAQYLRFHRSPQRTLSKKIRNWILGIYLLRFATIVYILKIFIFNDITKVELFNADYFLIGELLFSVVYITLSPKLLDASIFSSYVVDSSFSLEVAKTETHSDFKENERLSELADLIDTYFADTEVYLNSQLSAELLGDLMKCSHRQIGQAVKYKHDLNFRDYINKWRIQFIEDKLKGTDELSKYSFDYISEIAGFGSRQSFYSAFKKIHNTTPKEYFKINNEE